MRPEVPAGDAEVRARAIDPRRSCIVQAPAGSGKTSLLALRFLRLLAVVEVPEQIVAITFTRKAAAEMRHRIVAALVTAAAGPPPADAGLQAVELHRLATAALAQSRARGWGLESHPARLHVQTIDGLNHWLARRLPLAARIGLSAALVDDAEPLYEEAARRLAGALDETSEVAPLIARLARALDHEPWQLSRLVAAMLGAREVWLPKLLESGPDGDLRASIDRLLGAAIESELTRVAARLAEAGSRDLIALAAEVAGAGGPDGPLASLAGLSDLPPATLAATPKWLALADLLLTDARRPALRRKVDRRQGFFAASEGPDWAGRKRRMQSILDRLAGCPGLAGSLATLRCLPPDRLDDAQWERIEALRAVLPHAVAELLALFADRGSLDHAAVAAAARQALGDESAPTELALALDYRVRHLLVDEFQDTSPAQLRLLELLVAGWQAGDGRSLFCVGDPMQSIYAFREADVTLFLQAQRVGVGTVPLEPLRLGRNFRSSPAVMDWVNRSFARLLPLADDFERGAVRYSPAAAAEPDRPGAGVFVHPQAEGDERAAAQAVARIVEEARGRAPEGHVPSIAVLVRARASLPPLLAALRAAGIAYRGLELESLKERSAVRDLVALAKALLHEGDRPAWLAVLRAPWCGLSLADLHALAGEDRSPLPIRIADPAARAALSPDGAARLQSLAARLAAIAAERGERRLGSWVKAAWLALAGPATVEDASDLANAELLFAALDRLEQETGTHPAASAIDAVVERIKASPVGGDAATVQVMTIHRAKGLEFDVVIVPDLQRTTRGTERQLLYWAPVATGPQERGIVLAGRGDADGGGSADALERWMQRLQKEREELELGRVAYVAATRARHELHLVGCAKRDRRAEASKLREPPAGSLLRFFWPVLEAEFSASLLALPAAEDDAVASTRPRRFAPPLARLPAGFVAAEPPPGVRPPALRIAGEAGRAVRPDFDWASAIAQAVGQVVHQELHRLVQRGQPPAELAERPESWRSQLRTLGIDDRHLPAAEARVARAIAMLRSSPMAARLLDPASEEATSELALSAVEDGVVQSLRIDRSFVDGEGRRWIVDWKTSVHEGADIEAFLDNELLRYAPQLERYARVVRRIDPRPQVVGLYFPLHDAWRQLP